MFPTLTKIYDMVLLDRSEKLAGESAYFSNLQFGFQEGVGCLEASFTILESIICLKGVTNFLHAFLMFAKPLILFGLTGCYTSFSRSLVSKGGCGWLSKTFILM